MKRKIEAQLLQWKNKKKRKPLILYGARQIGKTYSVKEFGETYFDNMVYVNFELNTKLVESFDTDISSNRLINHIELFFGTKIDPERTLIFFDEIQACERALTSLKYFYEDAPQYHVIAAGSLLGITLNRDKYSFPVGKVDMLNMYAMDFEEFLLASEKEALAEAIRTCFNEAKPMELPAHTMAMEEYRNYLVIGGMPEVVSTYLEEGSHLEAIEVQQNIINAYIADMAKYTTPAEATKVMACFNSIPSQLAKDNRKFQYKVVAKGGTTSLFGASIDWLMAAGIVTKCERITRSELPLEAYKELSAFKLYMSDVGLLTIKSGTSAHDLILGNNHLFTGALTENYVAGALEKNRHKLYYWTSAGQAEVDFVLQGEREPIPIEVKGGTYVRSRSLSVYREKYKPKLSIRISGKNFGQEAGIKSIPLYAVFCI